MVCSKCGNGKIYAKGVCRICYIKDWSKNNKDKIKKTQRKYHDKIFNENPELKQKSLDKLQKSGVCKIIKKHHNDMRDDPESLTTEFMQKMIGVDCDN